MGDGAIVHQRVAQRFLSGLGLHITVQLLVPVPLISSVVLLDDAVDVFDLVQLESVLLQEFEDFLTV